MRLVSTPLSIRGESLSQPCQCRGTTQILPAASHGGRAVPPASIQQSPRTQRLIRHQRALSTSQNPQTCCPLPTGCPRAAVTQEMEERPPALPLRRAARCLRAASSYGSKLRDPRPWGSWVLRQKGSDREAGGVVWLLTVGPDLPLPPVPGAPLHPGG